MKIAVLGVGPIGGAAARQFANAGHELSLVNSRGPESLRGLAAELGPRVTAATAKDAVRDADVVLLSVGWPHLTEALASAGSLAGRIVVDAMNAYGTDWQPVDTGPLTSSEVVAQHIPGARVVKAFNTIFWERLRDEARPEGDDRLAIFVAGDDADAKAVVMTLVREIGFAPVDSGSLTEGGRLQQPDSPVYNVALTAPQAHAELARLRHPRS